MLAKKVYFVGIKGTGTCAFAELLHSSGYAVSGSDTNEYFYTDDILQSLGIPYYRSFEAGHVPLDAGAVVYSAAYDPDTHIELQRARKLSIPLLKYTDALGEFSRAFFSAGIAGTHGKTTTTALAGTLLRALELPAKILAGSAVPAFGAGDGDARSTLNMGDAYFVAETCEYRGHFLSFWPRVIVLTGVEHDHQDFFPTYESTRDMFTRYAAKLPEDGALIYCADDAGAREIARSIPRDKNIRLIPYGQKAAGSYRVKRLQTRNGRTSWRLEGVEGGFALRIPGKHNALNATAALALAFTLFSRHTGGPPGPAAIKKARAALEGFRGSKRRCETLGEAGGVLFIDDYGHHPTAVASTLEGIRAFYPGRRLVVSFMPHTYSRTLALLDEFARCFSAADILFLHKIYPSARERLPGAIAGDALFEETRRHHPACRYIANHEEAKAEVSAALRPGDIFLTMGAGDNWKLGRALLKEKGGGV